MNHINLQFNGVNLLLEYFILHDDKTPVIVKITVKNEDITELVGFDIKNQITTKLKNQLSC